MSLAEIREKNKQLVITTSIEYFVKYGIEKTKISDIAKSCELSERSLFRYFKDKTELVYEAAKYFWNESIQERKAELVKLQNSNLVGKEHVRKILLLYVDIFYSRTNELVFLQEAETYLFRKGLLDNHQKMPYIGQLEGNSPLLEALNDEVSNGNLISNIAIQNFYLNSYESVLGLLQKLSVGAFSECSTNEEKKNRLYSLVDVLVAGLYATNGTNNIEQPDSNK